MLIPRLLLPSIANAMVNTYNCYDYYCYFHCYYYYCNYTSLTIALNLIVTVARTPTRTPTPAQNPFLCLFAIAIVLAIVIAIIVVIVISVRVAFVNRGRWRRPRARRQEPWHELRCVALEGQGRLARRVVRRWP